MKLSDSKIIKTLNFLSSLALALYVVFLLVKIFSSGAPALSNSVKGYELYDVIANSGNMENMQTLNTWFHSKVVVQPTNRAHVYVRFKSYSQLFSLPAIVFQLSLITYWLLIGSLILCIKKLFRSFNKDQVFTNKNASLMMFGALVLMWLPIMRWTTQELFIHCISGLGLNDSGFVLRNGINLYGSETLVGIALLAFGFAFKAGVDLQKENESFI